MPKPKAVKLKALLKEIKVKCLVSGDKGLRLIFECDNPTNDDVSLLNELMDPQEQVNIGVWHGTP